MPSQILLTYLEAPLARIKNLEFGNGKVKLKYNAFVISLF